MTSAYPTFSIVVNTLNRADGLAQTLASFRQLRYTGAFEVIVVNGPSQDHTRDVLDGYANDIRIADCPLPNLSMSRNMGIDMSAGDLVAFIDDDAIPEPEWLSQLADGYVADEVGAVGGAVFDQTGHAMQYVYSTANRLGNANWQVLRATPEYCFPCSYNFPYLQGTNTSFRRRVLEEIGGFDEEIEFYLDETEVCCRLVDAGYLIHQLPNAYVHHKFAPSHIRDSNKITRHRYPIIKNKLYFSLKHGRRFHSLSEIIEDNQRFIAQQRADVEFHVQGGRLAHEEHAVLADHIERAWQRGLERGLRAGDDPTSRRTRNPEEFSAFPAPVRPDARTIVLVSGDYVPGHSGGIARFNYDLALSLAAQGQIVHVITQSRDVDRVDLEHGVWVHRLVVDPQPAARPPSELQIPEEIWAWSVTARREVERIAQRRRIDVVEAPLWNCEGVAFLVDRAWPVVVSLQTSLHAWLDNHSNLRSDPKWMEAFGSPMLALEHHVMDRADRLRAISHAIVVDLEKVYGISLNAKSDVQPLGLLDAMASGDSSPNERAANLNVLFVGRLEKRKGLDALLEAIPHVIKHSDTVAFEIVGDNTLVNERDITYKDEFLAKHRDAGWIERVRFVGKVTDEALEKSYRDADIFVAPSRYESFGLIFVEAMRAGKPSIGCDTGGIPEVVLHEETGLLVPVDSSRSLADAIIRLVDEPELRSRLGAQARRRYLERFTAARMANDSLGLYDNAIASFVEASRSPS